MYYKLNDMERGSVVLDAKLIGKRDVVDIKAERAVDR